jgi:CMP-N-acetylneuraminic acid synthetase
MKKQELTSLGVILARKGSKGILNKNLVPLCGRPLISYTIEFARNSQSLDALVLSTDCEKIAEVGSNSGIDVLMRPPEFATDKAPIDLALRHAVREMEKNSMIFDIVVVLYGNVPIRQSGIIDLAVKKAFETGAHSVETYAPHKKPPQRSYLIENDEPIPLAGIHVESYRRQDLEIAYYPDGAVTTIRRDVLMRTEYLPGESGKYFGTDRRAIIQEPDDTVDVDDPIDLKWAEFLMSLTTGKRH